MYDTRTKTHYIMPAPKIDGDNKRQIMARTGILIGISKSRALWRFGFLAFSEESIVHNVSVEEFHWYISTPLGKLLAHFKGMACDSPKRFQVLIGK